MIDDNAIQAALDYLRDNATAAAQARANRIYVEEFRKTIKARLMKASGAKSVAAQEVEAYADPAYVEHLEAIKQAVESDEKHRFLLKAAEARVEAWRTLCSNARAQGRVV